MNFRCCSEADSETTLPANSTGFRKLELAPGRGRAGDTPTERSRKYSTPVAEALLPVRGKWRRPPSAHAGGACATNKTRHHQVPPRILLTSFCGCPSTFSWRLFLALACARRALPPRDSDNRATTFLPRQRATAATPRPFFPALGER